MMMTLSRMKGIMVTQKGVSVAGMKSQLQVWPGLLVS